MKKYLLLFVAIVTIISCSDEKDLYEPPQEETQKDYSLTTKINVSSENLPDGTYFLLYTSDPSGEASDVEPIVKATAPFNVDVPVAKSVDKLYTYVNGEIKSYSRGNIVATAPSITGNASARSIEEPGSYTFKNMDASFITDINKYYPEGLVNVYGDNLKTSSDLVMASGVKEIINHPDGSATTTNWGNTKVWITYVSDGGANFAGSLWYYEYKIDESGTPIASIDDLNCVQIFNNATSKKEYPDDGPGKRVYLGEFEPGTRIGFKYLGSAMYGNAEYPKYSTPHYNALAYNGRISGGAWNNTYNGENIYGDCSSYSDNAYTAGVIRVWEYDNIKYATLGMENRLPSENYWDGDFNDMICLIEADPLFTENELPAPITPPTTLEFAGYWLFEDNYPLEGDYDFNDLVVRYAVTEVKDNLTIIDLQFMARGADFSNSFGVNGEIYFNNLGGYQNVYANQEKSDQYIQQIRVPAADEYIPMLNNGTTSFSLNTYWSNKESFPCVLDIPIVDKSTFKWCIEGKRIDAAYPRYKDWVDSDCTQYTDWYNDTPVAGLVWE